MPGIKKRLLTYVLGWTEFLLDCQVNKVTFYLSSAQPQLNYILRHEAQLKPMDRNNPSDEITN
ncbi:MAG: hypothetical protein ACE5HX_10720 [bacterium]